MTRSGPQPHPSILCMWLSAVSPLADARGPLPASSSQPAVHNTSQLGPLEATLSLSFGCLEPHRSSGEVSLDIHLGDPCHTASSGDVGTGPREAVDTLGWEAEPQACLGFPWAGEAPLPSARPSPNGKGTVIPSSRSCPSAGRAGIRRQSPCCLPSAAFPETNPLPQALNGSPKSRRIVEVQSLCSFPVDCATPLGTTAKDYLYSKPVAQHSEGRGGEWQRVGKVTETPVKMSRSSLP